MAGMFLQDRQVARERAKRRLVAARIRSNYKYKDTSKIPVKASEETEQKVKEHAAAAASRGTPFSGKAGRKTAGDRGGSSGSGSRADIGPGTHNNGSTGGEMSDVNLDRAINMYSNLGTKSVASVVGLLSGLPISTVLSAAGALAKRERNSRGGRDLSDYSNKEWGNYDTGTGPAENYGKGYNSAMRGIVSVYGGTAPNSADALRQRYWGTASEEKPK